MRTTPDMALSFTTSFEEHIIISAPERAHFRKSHGERGDDFFDFVCSRKGVEKGSLSRFGYTVKYGFEGAGQILMGEKRKEKRLSLGLRSSQRSMSGERSVSR